MWVKAKSGLSENTYQVTTPVTSHLLIAGAEAALVDSSLTALAPELLAAVSPLVAGEVPLRYLLLTHTHFDHIGGILPLRRAFPHLQVVGAPECSEFFSKREVLEQTFEENRQAALALKRGWDITTEEWQQALRLDRVLGEGDTLDLGDGVDVKAIGVPGHSHDSMAYYVRCDLALGAGEAVASYHGREKLGPSFLSSYDDYIASLDKLGSLDVRVLSLSHCGALTGDLAKKHVQHSRIAAEHLYQQTRERLQAGEPQEAVVTELFSEWGIEGIMPDGPFLGAQRTGLQKMIALVAEDL